MLDYGDADSATRQFLDRRYDCGSVLGSAQKFIIYHARAGMARKSLRHHLSSLEPLGQHFHDVPLCQVTSNDLVQYGKLLSLRYSPGTLRSTVGDIRQFFRFCHDNGWIDSFVAADIKKPTNKRKRSRKRSRNLIERSAPESESKNVIRAISSELHQKNLIWCDDDGVIAHAPAEKWQYDDKKLVRDLFIILFLYESGARVGGLASLFRREIVDEVSQHRDLYTVETFEKRRWEERDFSQHTATIFRIWDAIRPISCMEHAVIGWGNGHAPRPMSPDAVSSVVARRWTRAGYKPRYGHSLRHAKARRLRRVASLELASYTMGHSDVRVTAHYGIEDEMSDLECAALATMYSGEFLPHTKM